MLFKAYNFRVLAFTSLQFVKILRSKFFTVFTVVKPPIPNLVKVKLGKIGKICKNDKKLKDNFNDVKNLIENYLFCHFYLFYLNLLKTYCGKLSTSFTVYHFYRSAVKILRNILIFSKKHKTTILSSFSAKVKTVLKVSTVQLTHLSVCSIQTVP
jgi:hypothetical protein